jgi:hypothetical protein
MNFAALTPPGCFASTLPATQGGYNVAHQILPLLAGGDKEGGENSLSLKKEF